MPASVEWGSSATLSSNYLLRGVSRSYNDPALSVEMHARSAGGLYAGLWASSSRALPNGDTAAELGATIGIARPFNDVWSAGVSWSHYESPWTDPADFYAYDEFTATLGFHEQWLFSLSHSPNTSRYAPGFGAVRSRSTTAIEASFQHGIHGALHGFAGVGYFDLSKLFGTGYWYGSAGAGWTWRHWWATVSYVHPDGTARRLSYPKGASRRVVASLSVDF